MVARRSEPLRTCVGCRRVRPKVELMRLVVRGDAITADAAARAPGRGAYVCPDQGCIERAKANAGKALRAPRAAWAVEG